MARLDEIVEFVEKNPTRAADIMYYIQGMVLARKRHDSEVVWTFKDGSYGSVHFRMSDGYNYDKAASIPSYTFNGDGLNPNYTLCMSCNGKIFAVVDTDAVEKNHSDDIKKYAVKGFVGYDLYKNWDDCVRLIYV